MNDVPLSTLLSQVLIAFAEFDNEFERPMMASPYRPFLVSMGDVVEVHALHRTESRSRSSPPLRVWPSPSIPRCRGWSDGGRRSPTSRKRTPL